MMHGQTKIKFTIFPLCGALFKKKLPRT